MEQKALRNLTTNSPTPLRPSKTWGTRPSPRSAKSARERLKLKMASPNSKTKQNKPPKNRPPVSTDPLNQSSTHSKRSPLTRSSALAQPEPPPVWPPPPASDSLSQCLRCSTSKTKKPTSEQQNSAHNSSSPATSEKMPSKALSTNLKRWPPPARTEPTNSRPSNTPPEKSRNNSQSLQTPTQVEAKI